eukprot:2434707-Rhodomonas_salina.1
MRAVLTSSTSLRLAPRARTDLAAAPNRRTASPRSSWTTPRTSRRSAAVFFCFFSNLFFVSFSGVTGSARRGAGQGHHRAHEGRRRGRADKGPGQPAPANRSAAPIKGSTAPANRGSRSISGGM